MRLVLLLLLGCAGPKPGDSTLVSPGHGHPGYTSSPTPGTTPTTTDPSDDFESGVGPGWQEYDPHAAVTVRAEGGELVLELEARALWYNDEDGFAMYKLRSGDFAVETSVRVTRTSDSSQPPDGFVELAGLMVRDPASDGAGIENYVFLVLGSDDGLDTAGVPELAIETKDTVDGVSSYVNPAWPSGEAELRITRTGDRFDLEHRAIGAPAWLASGSYVHALPDTVQVGVVVYSAEASPDVTARFEHVSFR